MALENGRDRKSKFVEPVAAIMLLLLGIAPRFFLISRFPALPVSDFASLVAFGQHLRDHGLMAGGWFWEFFNPGLPLILCGLFTVVPCFDAGAAARIATAAACGTVPLLPFLLWRGVLPLRVRLLAGAVLAVWPGQILFSGVVAQDNWVILPSVALACLAVRSLVDAKRADPILAGVLYAAAAAIRQEMLIALLPLLVAAVHPKAAGKWRRAAAAAATVIVLLVAAAGYRYAASGRFALGTEHGGVSMLGAYVPGATANGWLDPYPFIASVRPELLLDRKHLLAEAPRLALGEVGRRPVFHSLRIVASLVNTALDGENANLNWSLGSSVLAAPRAARAATLIHVFKWPLRFESALIHGLFLAAVAWGIRRRNWAVAAIATAVLLKAGLHAVTVMQGRYLLVSTALEILTIVAAAYDFSTRRPVTIDREAKSALAVGAVAALALLLFAPGLQAFVERRDVDSQRTYRFTLAFPDGGANLSCTMEHGFLDSLIIMPDVTQGATLRTWHHQPAPGESAAAACDLKGAGEPRPLLLEVLDDYAPGGEGGRMVQRVEVDGVEVYSHDVAREAGSGWADIPLGNVGAGTARHIVVEVRAIQPDPGTDWGDAARTRFRMARP